MNRFQRLGDVTPAWAWAPYEPGNDAPWTRAEAAHLYRRAGFAATSAELDAALDARPADLVRAWVAEKGLPPDFQQELDDLAVSSLAGGNAKQLAAWWLYAMLATPRPLLEKTTLFWHGHFATSAEKVRDPRLMYRQNKLLRQFALGDFSALVQRISRDPAMLIYLDSDTNRKAHPNENYARELMELFCLGEGNYTEDDVLQVARCFTGWEIRRDEYYFNRYQHDNDEKSFLGKSGNFGGEDAVRIILEQDAAPKFIVRKLIRYFLFDEPEAPDALVAPLAAEYRKSGFDTGTLVSRLLSSNLFFSRFSRGRKVRSPVDAAVGLLRALESRTNVVALQADLDNLGHSVFFPPNVKGWDGGRTWINSSALLGRANMVRRIVDSGQGVFEGDKLAGLAEKHGADSPEKVVNWLLELLLAVDVPDKIKSDLVQVVTDSNNRSRGIANAVHAIATLPEFQLA
jgi:uncharacterized protein (DUF1800 family)